MQTDTVDGCPNILFKGIFMLLHRLHDARRIEICVYGILCSVVFNESGQCVTLTGCRVDASCVVRPRTGKASGVAKV
jgi:predicted AlkP superfamily phosphohydrolase/phosphomutase